MFGIIALWSGGFLAGAVPGAVAGMATRRVVNRPVVIMTTVASVVFGSALVGFAIWAADCPQCAVGTQNSREEMPFFFAYSYGIALGAALVGLWTASALGRKLRAPARANEK